MEVSPLESRGRRGRRIFLVGTTLDQLHLRININNSIPDGVEACNPLSQNGLRRTA